MTDLEMDLLMAKAEIADLKRQLGNKCSFGKGVEMKIGGIPVDPCAALPQVRKRRHLLGAAGEHGRHSGR